jgi:hypothetical protein
MSYNKGHCRMANIQLSANLVEITTPRQAKNGTRMFHDFVSGCRYGSYASGYVRRIYTVRNSLEFVLGPAHLNHREQMYPLNPRASIGNGLYRSTICIMISNEADRIAMINEAADRGWTYSGSRDKSYIIAY